MNYQYGYLQQKYGAYLLVLADERLVFVGGPQDDLGVARHLLRLTAADTLVPAALPTAITQGVAALLSGWQQQLAPQLYAVFGTPFQKQVYAQLRQIPYGQTWTYSELATRVGKPRAVRAIAHAVASNPLLIVQPCHRVVPKAGGLGQYRGGTTMKQKLLDLEAGKRVQF
ncbi:methylated-DNA--[protein]-cysteine S-methyltransferase [Lacticaseibacillus zhaodongensis]|uniref:methylated-DNA--[protein]-cysteine S-methyltransferase n=1 Tax=Lacticaseibacillus zhaodongensis TaxID=2668065 RepID=UPI0012D33901|nr:methylated-DNA--[protein]-cysteine S-methyltransferase [Lacticaseibacillus zhaodongensis]